MRFYFLTFLGSIFLSILAIGQSEAKFTIEVSKTTVQVGESFDVKFVLESAKNGKFITPDLESAGFTVLNSSQSSSFSLSRGVSTSTAVYEYLIMARDTGWLEIPSAVLKTGAEELRTPTQRIHVLPGDGNSIAEPSNRSRQKMPAQDPKKKIKTIRL